jgi:hypothetical protein
VGTVTISRFKLKETLPGLPGEYVCAGCEAPMVVPGDGSGSGEQEAEIIHGERCEYAPGR